MWNHGSNKEVNKEVNKEDSKELTDQNLKWEEGACQANEGWGWLLQWKEV